MPRFNIAEAAVAGLGLFGRRPLAALAWGGLGVAFLGLLLILFGPAVATTVLTLAAKSRAGASAPMEAVFGLIGEGLGFLLILAIGSLVLGAVVACAVYRAVIHPTDSAFLFIRLGPSELWLMAVNVVASVLAGIVQGVLSIPLGIVTLLSLGRHADPATAIVVSAGRLAIYALLIWLYLRFSMAGPMTFRRRRFCLFESWALTRGHVWPLAGVGLLVGVIALGLYAVLIVIGFAGGAAIIGGLGLADELKALTSQPPSAWMSVLAPIVEWVLLLGWVGGAILTPLTLAPWAFIYQRLSPEEGLAEAPP